MSVFNIITLLGGLAMFLFGMSTMSNGLEKTAGGKLEKTLQKMTDKYIKEVDKLVEEKSKEIMTV